MPSPDERPAPRLAGRYAIYEKIASGGMATVHFGRLLGPVGFSRTVAIKRLHPHFTEDPDFVSMFVDEARIAGRIRHANVVPTLDIVPVSGELFLVLEFVHGETLGRILRTLSAKREAIPLPIVAAIFSGVLAGLHAAHEAKAEDGTPLDIVHRDVSPQNVIIGVDGVARVLDFGVAKAAGRLQTTRKGQLKGKLAYMAPEQIEGVEASRRTDVYGASVCLWEAVTGRRLFDAANDAEMLRAILQGKHVPPSTHRGELPPELDPVVMRGLDRDPEKRFGTAREMGAALEAVLPLAAPSAVAEWLETVAAEAIAKRGAQLAEIERASSKLTVAAPDDDEATIPAPRTYPVSDPPPPADVSASQLTAAPLSANVATSVPPASTAKGVSGRRALLVAAAIAVVGLVVALLGPLRGKSAANAASPAPSDDTAVPDPGPPPVDPPVAVTQDTATANTPSANPTTASAPSAVTTSPPAPAATFVSPRPTPRPTHTSSRPVTAPPAPPAPPRRSPPPAPTPQGAIVFTNPG